MTSKIAIVGAGHAGVEAAFHLAAKGCEVDLWSNESALPYFRPRLIAVAFHQAEPTAIAIKPQSAYEASSIRLRHHAVTTLSLSERTVEDERYDGILLTQGAKPFVPPFKGDLSGLHTLWTLEEAVRLRAAVQAGKRLTIIGGGILGIEAALRAVKAGLIVTLVEAAPALLSGCLGQLAHTTLVQTLKDKGIQLFYGHSIDHIQREALTLSNGMTLEHDLLLCATGARPNLQLLHGLPACIGLTTDCNLQVAPYVFAAGDLAQPNGAPITCAVRRAQLMGLCAAKNLYAALHHEPLTPWMPPRLPTFMKVDDVEIHTLGNVLDCANTIEKRMDDGSRDHICQTLLYCGESCVGIRSVGTRENIAQWEKTLQ